MMSIHRKPTTVGEILIMEFLKPLELTQNELARAMGVPNRLVNQLCRNRRGVTADTALILARVFGNNPQFWLNLQQQVDLWEAMSDPKRIARINQARALGSD